MMTSKRIQKIEIDFSVDTASQIKYLNYNVVQSDELITK